MKKIRNPKRLSQFNESNESFHLPFEVLLYRTICQEGYYGKDCPYKKAEQTIETNNVSDCRICPSGSITTKINIAYQILWQILHRLKQKMKPNKIVVISLSKSVV